jgi:hypothetical protein
MVDKECHDQYMRKTPYVDLVKRKNIEIMYMTLAENKPKGLNEIFKIG